MKKLANFTIENLFITPTMQPFTVPEKLNRKIEKIWAEYEKLALKTGRQLWNGTVYRLADITTENNQTLLTVSPIEYKHYLASAHLRTTLHTMPFHKRINGLYVGAHIVTADNKYIIGKTAVNSLFPHSYDVISGSLNKDEMELHSTTDLIRFLKSELEEETDISENFIEDIAGISMVVSASTRIGIFFRIKLTLSSHQLRKYLKKNFEHTKLLVLNEAKYKQLIHNKNYNVNPTVAFTFKEMTNRA